MQEDQCNDPKNNQLSAAFPPQPSTQGLQVCNVTNPVFDVNAMLKAAQTYLSLNNVVNELIGIEARWFRAVPQMRSQDVIFQEYTLSNVEDTPLCIKVVLPDGAFPDSKYNYDLMGLEYEIPLTIDIDKKYWEGIAGFGTAPQKKDIVYLPMPNKLYQVESSYLKRGFMEQETTWVCNLKKYQPESSRREGDNLKQTIDQYTVSEEELFGTVINNNIEKLVDDKQFNPFNSTEHDKYKILNTSLKIISAQLNIFGTIPAESYYDLTTSDSSVAVIYNASDNILSTDDRSLITWNLSKISSNLFYDVEYIQSNNLLTYPANYKIKIKTPKKAFNIGDIFNISRPGSLNFYATVIDINNTTGEYSCKIDQIVIDYLSSIKTNWSDARNYKMQIKQPINLLSGVSDTNEYSLKIDIYANQFIKIIYGSQEHIAILNEKIEDNDWYGYVINIGNSWNQYNVNVWKKSDTNTGDKLRSVFYETIPFIKEEIIVNNYFINKSDSYLTNIRLYNSTLEEEKQSNELLTRFSTNADKALILDNCDELLRIPYISKTK